MRARQAAPATTALLPTLAQGQAVPEGCLLASTCFKCHGTNGKGPGFDKRPDFDKLAGKASSEIYKELVEFRSGKEGKAGNGIMAKHALGYTSAHLSTPSTYLST